ncbi:rhodanese-like domain-containing protein [Chlorobium sp. BLA1]|uniref:rhodanese-like domain-containing protein n=1 Tax=Candidatus Chlorobium masyuteum TaxID=2716876 RepID=UPI00142242C4|nr:rhodanese-like domain-containing protein [Candidatus Chlorobium masyuteum]NHQ59850.1 rhodanese-like domain-containing protein [Candidatus Chlorobium masyuteum]
MPGKLLQGTLVASILLLSIVSPALSPLHAAAPSALAKEESGELTLAATKAIFDTHSACFVDARSEYAYYKLHIKGATSLSSSRFDEQYPDFRKKQALETPIVVYCAEVNCGKARHVAKKLRKNGYRNVRVFSGGLIEWSQARFPVEG